MDTVDPTSIPQTMTRNQLEWWVLFGICVAGKSAKQTEAKLNAYIANRYIHGDVSPFEVVKNDIRFDLLGQILRDFRFGQYTRIEKAFREVIKLDVAKLTLADLEAIPGIGPKTARMILLYSDPQFDGVPLDTHILKYLGTLGYKVPKSTPPAGNRYKELEDVFQAQAMALDMTVRGLDTLVWKAYSSGNLESLPMR